VIFENDTIRVIEITLKKGQKLGMHSHNKGLSYGLNKSKFRSTGPDGKSEVVRMKKGSATWGDGETHAVENLGGKSRMLSIELKG
jgi:hypothetical protein